MESPTTTTTSDHTNDQSDQQSLGTATRDQCLQSLYSRGGFILACKTVVALYRVTTATDGATKWTAVNRGILTIVSKTDQLSLIIGDLESGEISHEFRISLTKSRYTEQKSHFHSFLSVDDGVMYGVGFVEVGVAEKVLRVVSRLSGCGSVTRGNGVGIPQAKRGRPEDDKYGDWVVIDTGDVPPISEETDFGVFSRKKESKTDDFKIADVSETSYFRHLNRGDTSEPTNLQRGGKGVGPETPVAGGNDAEGTFEWGTKRSSSFMEISEFESDPQPAATTQQPHQAFPVPPPSLIPVPTTGPVSGDISSSSSFTSGFSSFGVPEPPDMESSAESLLDQINTFDRKALHHVTSKEMTSDKRSSPRKGSLATILQNGFEKLLPKLQEMHHVATVASINSEGEEEWSDDEIDGQLFE